MRVGDVVIHPKYGKGNVVKIMTDKDQVICFLANENRYFTKAGAEFMVQAADISKASMGADFDHTAKPVTSSEAKMIHQCEFCSREFKNYQGLRHHQWQCPKNPDRKIWTRGPVKKKRGAQPGNQHARKYKPTERVLVKEDLVHTVPPIPDAEAETVNSGHIATTLPGDYLKFNEPPVSRAAPTPPTDQRWSTDINQHPATDPIYYLIMAALSVLLLCGLIAAALGIKLLLTN